MANQYPPGVTVSSFTQHNGIMAWIIENGASFSVGSCTYDPYRTRFVQGSQGDYAGVSQLQVQDGMVAFVAVLATGKQVVVFATYNPNSGTWVGSHLECEEGFSVASLLVKDGVVAWMTQGDQGTDVAYVIWDPRGGWFRGELLAMGSGSDSLTIRNATVYFERQYIGGGTISWFFGYKAFENPQGLNFGTWLSDEVTTPFAYFTAQPESGPAPLWIWFTDMSIGGTSWNWQFGDGSTSTDRSPYHTFIDAGNFQVTQQMSGPNGSDTHSRTVLIRSPGGNTQGMLHLLLTD